MAVVQTASFSGNAFSVKNARGRFRSPRGHAGSRAERADMARWRGDIVGRQRVAERRHVAIEPAHRAALVDDGAPVGVRFAGGKGAVAEVGKGRLEADDRARRAPAIRPVAGGTGGAVQLLAGPLAPAVRRGVAGACGWRACTDNELTTMTAVLSNDWATRRVAHRWCLYQGLMRTG